MLHYIASGAMTMSKKTTRLSNECRQLASDLTSFVLERLHCMTTVKLSGREGCEKRGFVQHLQHKYLVARHMHWR